MARVEGYRRCDGILITDSEGILPRVGLRWGVAHRHGVLLGGCFDLAHLRLGAHLRIDESSGRYDPGY